MFRKIWIVLRLFSSRGIIDLLTLWNRGLRQLAWPSSVQSRVPSDHDGPLPWLTYGAIDYLDQVVSVDAVVLEIGGGYSTHWWKSRGNTVFTLESDSNWLEFIAKHSDKPQLCETSSLTVSWLKDSLDAGQLFDVVLVDGVEPRSDYLKEASLLVMEGGILVVDNADRDSYSAELNNLHNMKRLDFFGLGPCNRYAWCTSVFFVNPPKVLGRSRLDRYQTISY